MTVFSRSFLVVAIACVVPLLSVGGCSMGLDGDTRRDALWKDQSGRARAQYNATPVQTTPVRQNYRRPPPVVTTRTGRRSSERYAGVAPRSDGARRYRSDLYSEETGDIGRGARPADSGPLMPGRRQALGNAPPARPSYQSRASARFMGPSWRGHETSSGEIFDPQRLTGAHATLPLPSYLYVTNRMNGRTVLIRVNDRVPSRNGGVVIISQAAAQLLGFTRAARAEVDLQYAGPAGVRPNAIHETAFLKQQPWYRNDLLRAN